ncbi:MAG: flagellar type III secretion system pore protein FliP [Lachnospiraceae bacterium]
MLQFMKKHRKAFLRLWAGFIITGLMCIVPSSSALAAETPTTGNNLISIGISTGSGSDMASVLQMVLVLTVLALAPSILIMLTSFTRIVIVMHFTRAAVGTQTVPPNQIIVGLSLFLTFFVMAPTFSEVYSSAIEPLANNEMTFDEAFNEGIKPIRKFMLSQVSSKDLQTFLDINGTDPDTIETEDDIPTLVLIPSFIISELRTAFIIGFLIYMPFIVIDMVVSSTLMSMGMMMLPPTTISMPFKILLFVMADGWNLVIGNLIKTFY